MDVSKQGQSEETGNSEPSQVVALTSGRIQTKAYLRLPPRAMMAIGAHGDVSNVRGTSAPAIRERCGQEEKSPGRD